MAATWSPSKVLASNARHVLTLTTVRRVSDCAGATVIPSTALKNLAVSQSMLEKPGGVKRRFYPGD